jgi:Protein of unknown function (DUF3352)
MPRVRAPRVRLAARRAWDRWLSLSIYTRRRVVALGAVVAVVALVALLAIPALPCGAPGGGGCAPSDDAVDLVPADALAYAHFDADPGTGQYAEAAAIAARLPTLSQQVVGRLVANLPAPNGGQIDFGSDVGPWFGGEAALAILPAGGRAAQEVQLLQVDDPKGAATFADAIASGSPRTITFKDVPIRVDSRGLATALVGGFLAIGAKGGVERVVDTQAGATPSVAGDPAAGAVRRDLPSERLADFYLSKDGIVRLVAKPGAPLAGLSAAIDPGASQGASVALTAGADGLDLQVRSTLDPTRAAAHPSVFAGLPFFEPSLPASLSADSLGYLGIGNPATAIAGLAARASAKGPDPLKPLLDVFDGVAALEKVDLRSLLPTLRDEAALALEPGSSSPAGGPQAGNATVPSGGARSSPRPPILTFIAPIADATTASKTLADLEAPVAKAFAGSGAGFDAQKLGGVEAHSIRVSPAVDLTYAIVDSLLVIATQPDGVAAVSADQPGLSDAELFRQATADLPDDVSVLGYLNLDGLIALGESAGLASDPAYATFAPEIQRLEALGLAVQSTPSELSTDARLVIAPDSGSTSATGTPAD